MWYAKCNGCYWWHSHCHNKTFWCFCWGLLLPTRLEVIVVLHKQWMATKLEIHPCVLDCLRMWMIPMFWVYKCAMQREIFDMVVGSLYGLPPYLLGDKGYPLLPWLMTLHNQNEKHHLVLELLYYCKHKWGRSIVGNSSGIMKQMFEELLRKIGLCIKIVLDVFNACSLFHNLILGRKKVDVEEFMEVI